MTESFHPVRLMNLNIIKLLSAARPKPTDLALSPSVIPSTVHSMPFSNTQSVTTHRGCDIQPWAQAVQSLSSVHKGYRRQIKAVQPVLKAVCDS